MLEDSRRDSSMFDDSFVRHRRILSTKNQMENWFRKIFRNTGQDFDDNIVVFICKNGVC